VKKKLRVFVGGFFAVVLLSVVSLYLIDFVSDKTWLSAYILQCNKKTWEPSIPKNSDFDNLTTAERLDVFDILLSKKMKNYYFEMLGVKIYNVETLYWTATCSACDCPHGEVMILISKKDEAKMINEGFEKISRLKLYYDITWTRRKTGYF